MSNITSSNITLPRSTFSPFSTDFLLSHYNFSSLLPVNLSVSDTNTISTKDLAVRFFTNFFNGDLFFKPTKNNLGLFNSNTYSQISLIPSSFTVFHARDIRSILIDWLVLHPEHIQIARLIQECIETSGECLDLSGQKLKDLDDGLIEILSLLTWVKTLKLSFNELRQIPPNAFAQMSQLKTLFLNNNHLTTLDENLFSNLPNLLTLYLNHNQLTKLHPNLFSNLLNLSTLRLNNNQLTELHPNLFSNLSMLATLRLDNNQLTNLSSNLFFNLPDLSTLYLSHNRLTNLHPNLFNAQTQLFFLFLENNSLTRLDNQIFDGLANNAALHLDAYLLQYSPNFPNHISIYPCESRLDESPK